MRFVFKRWVCRVCGMRWQADGRWMCPTCGDEDPQEL